MCGGIVWGWWWVDDRGCRAETGRFGRLLRSKSCERRLRRVASFLRLYELRKPEIYPILWCLPAPVPGHMHAPGRWGVWASLLASFSRWISLQSLWQPSTWLPPGGRYGKQIPTLSTAVDVACRASPLRLVVLSLRSHRFYYSS